MPRFQGPCFILRRWDVGESDQLVSFLMKGKGKLRGIAKGAKRSKRRFGGLLSPFLLVEMECFEREGRELVRIDGCSLIHYYASISGDLERLLSGCCVLEVLERVLPEGEGGDEGFALLGQTLDSLEREEDIDNLLWGFLARCLGLLGLRPLFGACIYCRRPLRPSGVFGFSVPQGGAVCGACMERGAVTHRVSAEALSLLGRWQEASGGGAEQEAPVGKRTVQEARKILEAFYLFHVGREFRSFRVMREIRGKRRSRPVDGKGGAG